MGALGDKEPDDTVKVIGSITIISVVEFILEVYG